MTIDSKLSMTRQRKVILDELKKVKTHPSADEVYEIVRGVLPHISLGTVYRNLELLAAHGQIQMLRISGNQMRFDGNAEEHYHIRCTGCGRVDDVAMELVPGLENGLSDTAGYEITGCRLEFTGLCPVCRNTGREK